MLLQQLNNCFPKAKATNLKNYLWSSRASQMALLVKKNLPANAGDIRDKRCGFNPWAGKIPSSRKWQPTAVLLPGKFHGQRKLVGYNHGVPKSQTQLSNWAMTFSSDVHTNDIQILLYPPPHLSIVTWSYPFTIVFSGLINVDSA